MGHMEGRTLTALARLPGVASARAQRSSIGVPENQSRRWSPEPLSSPTGWRVALAPGSQAPAVRRGHPSGAGRRRSNWLPKWDSLTARRLRGVEPPHSTSPRACAGTNSMRCGCWVSAFSSNALPTPATCWRCNGSTSTTSSSGASAGGPIGTRGRAAPPSTLPGPRPPSAPLTTRSPPARTPRARRRALGLPPSVNPDRRTPCETGWFQRSSLALPLKKGEVSCSI